MPEYHFDRSLDQDTWEALDEFTQGYIETAFWTGDEEAGIPYMGLHDLSPVALAEIKTQCEDFQKLAHDDLQRAYADPKIAYSAARAGHDFWLTRNGHGTGFWDRGLGDLRTDTVGGRLSRDAKSFGGSDLYVGEDGRVHIEG